MMPQHLKEPTPDLVESYVVRFDNDAEYAAGEKIIADLFRSLPDNRDIDDVWHKVVVLNGLYSTNIWATYKVASHICELDIDPKLEEKSLPLVNNIAQVEIKGKTWHFRSFASKYCSWHKPEVYPIYDSFVDRLIWAYRKLYAFADFKHNELGDYPRFREIIERFRDYFGLSQFNFKELDKFLWLYSKKVFPQ